MPNANLPVNFKIWRALPSLSWSATGWFSWYSWLPRNRSTDWVGLVTGEVLDSIGLDSWQERWEKELGDLQRSTFELVGYSLAQWTTCHLRLTWHSLLLLHLWPRPVLVVTTAPILGVGISRNRKIIFSGEKYQVSLPQMPDHPPLLDNYELSLKQLYSLLTRLRHTPRLLAE